jgi:hypothetical protein
MRLARRAPLLIAFFLLASAATAHAECAWVLWESATRFTQSNKTPTTSADSPVRAYTTKQDCDRELSATLAEFQSDEGLQSATTMSASPTPWTRAGEGEV